MPGVTNNEDDFQLLVKALSEKLGPSSGIDSDDVDEHELQQLMEEYISDESEWSKYSLSDPTKSYTRNLVDKGNGKSNLLILVWAPGKRSPIHDHAKAHCIMKILKGKLTETRYATPPEGDNDTENGPLEVLAKTTYEANQVTYMSDKLGIHRISNPDEDNYAVSLHLYTPPNVEKLGTNVFNEANGHKSNIPGCKIYSEYGVHPGAT